MSTNVGNMASHPSVRPVRRESMIISSVKVTASATVSRLTGFLRDMVLAAVFGASGVLDAYFVATTIPIMFQSAVGGLLRSSFIAVYSRVLAGFKVAANSTGAVATERGAAQAGQAGPDAGTVAPKPSRFSALILVISLLLAAAAMVVIMALADILVLLVAPGLSPENAKLAAVFLRILAPLTIMGVVEGWAASILNSHGVFGPFAGVGIPRNLVIIGAVLFTAKAYGTWGLVGGTLVGFTASTLWLFTLAWRLSGLARPSLSSERAELLQVVALAWPIMLAGLCAQLQPVVDQILASGIGPGTISSLSFGTRLATLPVGLFGSAVSTVIYPRIARRAAETVEYGPRAEMRAETGAIGAGQSRAVFDLIQKGWVGALLVLAPFVGFVIALRVPLVDLVYGRGAFGAEAVATTATAMAFYALALPAWGCQPVSTRAFYALGNSRVPATVSVFAVLMNVGASVLFSHLIGVGGIALGTAVAVTFGTVALSILLARRLRLAPTRELWLSLAKIAAACALGWLAAWAVTRPAILGPLAAAATGLAPANPSLGRHLAQVVEIILFGSVYLGVYAGTVFALRVPEAEAAWRSLWGRIARRRTATHGTP